MVLGSGVHHRLGLTAEVVGRNWVRWSAAQLRNESALLRMTDSTPEKKRSTWRRSWMDQLTPFCWLQTTQPTSGGAVTADSRCCANCVEPSRTQQWGPDLPFFWACEPAGCLALLLTKAGDVETNPGPTTLNKQVWICDICHKQIHVRKQISIRCNRMNTWCTSDVQVSAKHNTQIPGPAIYTDNPDSHFTQT